MQRPFEHVIQFRGGVIAAGWFQRDEEGVWRLLKGVTTETCQHRGFQFNLGPFGFRLVVALAWTGERYKVLTDRAEAIGWATQAIQKMVLYGVYQKDVHRHRQLAKTKVSEYLLKHQNKVRMYNQKVNENVRNYLQNQGGMVDTTKVSDYLRDHQNKVHLYNKRVNVNARSYLENHSGMVDTTLSLLSFRYLPLPLPYPLSNSTPLPPPRNYRLPLPPPSKDISNPPSPTPPHPHPPAPNNISSKCHLK